ncbi:hypothetical protein HaLaN_31500 [Haematococcus lacustris]|uniref:Uncharacterized protein n=1 Tax=Haematococcus lacustris TaxID=44745 RepID=A0A6A0AJ30_HAELA|nr:hypothetical protein HaLaN_31500 [Haematococcus lacustris]
MADAAKTISLTAVPHAYVTCLPLPAVAATEGGAQLRQASRGCGCTRGSVAWVPSSSCVPPACETRGMTEAALLQSYIKRALSHCSRRCKRYMSRWVTVA